MKILATILSLAVLSSPMVYAAETVSEKATATTNDIKRDVKGKVHRVDEKICDMTDKSCVGKKVKNRAKEAGDYTKDKASEVKNVIDNDKGL